MRFRAVSHRSTATSNRTNNLHHHGWQLHDYVDPDTESKCDSRCASFEHLILCVGVITQAEGRRNSQNCTMSWCEIPAMMVWTSFVICAVQQNKSLDFSRECDSHTWQPRSIVKKKAPAPAAKVQKFKDRHLHKCAVKVTSETDTVGAVCWNKCLTCGHSASAK